MRTMKYLSFLILLSLALGAKAQLLSVTATLTDTDGQTWNNATCTIQAYNSQGVTPQYNGTPIPTQPACSINSSGVLSASLYNTNTLFPVASQYRFSIQSNTSAPASSFLSPVTTTNMSSDLSALITAPRFNAGYNTRGYLDVEAQAGVIGLTYYNVTTPAWRQCTVVSSGACTTWVTVGSGGGGIPYPDGVGFPTVNSAAWGTTVPTFLPENYGALGNGTHDDRSAFDAAIAAAAPVCGIIVLSAGKSYYSATGFIDHTNCVSIIGFQTMPGFTWLGPPNVTPELITDSSTANILDVGGTSVTVTNQQEIGGFGLRRTVLPTSATADGLYAHYTSGIHVHDMFSADSAENFHDIGDRNGLWERNRGEWGFNGVTGYTNAFVLKGMYLDSTGDTVHPSVTFRDNTMVEPEGRGGVDPAITYGFYEEGTRLADVRWLNSESANENYGRYVHNTGTGPIVLTSEDQHYILETHDGSDYCVYIDNLHAATQQSHGVNLDGLYCGGHSAIHVSNSDGITFTNLAALNFNAGGATPPHGIDLSNDSSISISPTSGCLLSGAGGDIGMSIDNVTNSVLGCDIYASNGTTYQVGMQITNSTNNVISSMTMGGPASSPGAITVGIKGDTASLTGNSFWGNQFDPSVVTTQWLNTDTGSSQHSYPFLQPMQGGGYIAANDQDGQGTMWQWYGTQSGEHKYRCGQSLNAQWICWDDTTGVANFESYQDVTGGVRQNYLALPNYGAYGFLSSHVTGSSATPDAFFNRDASVAGQIDVGKTFPAMGTSPAGIQDGGMGMSYIKISGGATTVYKCAGGTFDGLLATSSGACTGGTGTATHLFID